MPNHKSAEKRVRQNEKRRDINRGNRGRLRTGVKKLRAALESGETGAAQGADEGRRNGLVHRRNDATTGRAGVST